MLEQGPKINQARAAIGEQGGSTETEDRIYLIETDFVVEDIGLSSNIPPKLREDTLAIVNNETNIASFLIKPDRIREVIERLEELGIGITAANFDLASHRK